jgi:nicotinamidase/pyrazinamidase
MKPAPPVIKTRMNESLVSVGPDQTMLSNRLLFTTWGENSFAAEATPMIKGPLVFVDIDTQRDFLEPSGALYVPGAQAILPNLQRLTHFAATHATPILATACNHTLDDPELAQFPPHCMTGTVGQQRVTATAAANSLILGLTDRLTGELPAHLTLHKREFDVFSRPDADDLIARYNRSAPTFVVYGVATDYCVRAAVEGLLARGCRVAVVTDAVRAIDPEKEADLMTDWAQRGVLLVITDRVIQ